MENPNSIIENMLCVSVSHKKAPVEIIESVYWKDDAEDITDLRSKSISKELVLIQTCNRIEIISFLSKYSQEEINYV